MQRTNQKNPSHKYYCCFKDIKMNIFPLTKRKQVIIIGYCTLSWAILNFFLNIFLKLYITRERIGKSIDVMRLHNTTEEELAQLISIGKNNFFFSFYLLRKFQNVSNFVSKCFWWFYPPIGCTGLYRKKKTAFRILLHTEKIASLGVKMSKKFWNILIFYILF